MTDRLLFGLAVLRDALEDRLEDLPGRLVLGEHRAVLHVVEAATRGVRPFHDQRAADDGVLVLERDPEIPVSHRRAKVRPPRRLHETGVRRRFHEPVPGVPPLQLTLDFSPWNGHWILPSHYAPRKKSYPPPCE